MSRAESKARTREALLASARKVFVEKGFAAATVEEIAAEAGFTRGAFYANFTDKTDAFWAVAHAEDAALFDDIESAIADADDERQLSLLDKWFERLLEGPPLQRAFAELRAQSPSGADRERAALLMAENRRRIATVIAAQAVQRGTTLAVAPDAMAAIFLGLADGLADQHALDPDAVPVSLIADAFAYVWLGASVAGEDAALLSRGSGSSPPRRRSPGRRRS